MAKPLPADQRQKEAAPVSPEALTPAGGGPEHEETARVAYQDWEQRGSPIGTPEEDWFRAEEEAKQHMSETPTTVTPESSPPHNGEPAGSPGSESGTKKAAVKEAPKEESPAKDAPAKKASAKEEPAMDDPAKDAPAKSQIAKDKKVRYLKLALGILLLLNVAAAAFFLWLHFRPKGLGEGFASGNGRIEAVELDVTAKSPGRIMEILVDDGDMVSAGQVVARMDTDVLHAQLRQAQAEEAQARNAEGTALAIVGQRESEQAAAMALVTQREAEQAIAEKTTERSQILATEHAASIQEFDNDLAHQRGTAAAVLAAKAQVVASQATINAARSQVLEAKSNVVAAQAAESRLQAEIDDTKLKAARDGRVQFRIAQPGEVLAPGGKVLSMVDLSDVTMTFFLPEPVVGRVAIGSEVHIVLDAAPQYVIPATVSFVADIAQFTPKSVETQSEREKLVFRVKARIDPALLHEHLKEVKSGLPGMAYVRVDPSVPWPEKLQTRMAQ